MKKSRVVIHTKNRLNYQSLMLTKADELKLITMFSAKEINDQLHIAVSEKAYTAIFNPKAYIKKQNTIISNNK